MGVYKEVDSVRGPFLGRVLMNGEMKTIKLALNRYEKISLLHSLIKTCEDERSAAVQDTDK